MSEWQEYEIGSLLDFIVDNRGKNPTYQEFGIPVIDNFMVKNQKNVDLKQTERFISDETFENFIRKYSRHKDVLITLVGTVANLSMAPKGKSVIIQNCVGLRSGSKLCSDFLFYNLKFNKGRILNLNRGSAQPNVKVGDLKLLKINLPPLATQQKIAKILSNYDDLIDNNLKRIQLLEESVRLTYEEWFLNFRVNGKKLDIDPDTDLPLDWEKRKLTDVIELNPLTKVEKGVEHPFIPMSSISETNMVISDIEKRIPKGGTKFKNLDTLLARITPCLENGKTGFVQCLKDNEVATGSTEFIVMRAKSSVSPYYVYALARTDTFREIAIQSMSGSDGRQRVRVEVFKKILLNIPSSKILNQYHLSMKSVFNEIKVLTKQSQILKEAQNILLPRLMTDMIDIEKMDIAV